MPSRPPTADDKAARARSLMIDYVERVAQHFGFVRVEEGVDAARIRALFESAKGDALLREAELRLARDPGRLAAARNHADLLRRIDRLLAEAAGKLEQDSLDARAYQDAPAQDLDPDPVFGRAATRQAMRDWPS